MCAQSSNPSVLRPTRPSSTSFPRSPAGRSLSSWPSGTRCSPSPRPLLVAAVAAQLVAAGDEKEEEEEKAEEKVVEEEEDDSMFSLFD
uniref:Uncharacterized protein n=1 Tax=Leersia perrieri TaxID=77586 RepID=A0A0D9WXB0_9ORYZ